MLDFFLTLENQPAVVAFSESLFAYPVVQGLHVLSLALAVGLLALADLRLARVLFTAYPAKVVVAGLRPWFIGGYALMFVTGVLLFLPKASALYASPLFWTKMALIALAGVNALYFELNYRQGHDAPESLRPKLAGLASLGLWVAVIVTGRLLAYF
ncbi:MAG: hypothetical protein LBE21_04025 [Pseudomonadales bacterium]|jgi:hypothetical protein|nr:hypothetical protein [Pseudomonadales bacterium]